MKECGNRLPNFTFEVKKRTSVSNLRILEDNIESVVMISGRGGDTVVQKITDTKNHDTWVPTVALSKVNQHNPSSVANSILSLNQLSQTLHSG
ncbi:MAG: hypothetical protein MRQ13_03065 [Candidatus Midichloria sp.]|nr:hypothetical protein [Candidatus Midichloria sp.]